MLSKQMASLAVLIWRDRRVGLLERFGLDLPLGAEKVGKAPD